MATTVVQLLIVLHLLVATAAQRRLPVAWPGCRDRCGNITVPYPFGIGAGCYRDEAGANSLRFELECDDGRSPPRLVDANQKNQLADLPLAAGEARAYLNATRHCYNSTGGFAGKNTNKAYMTLLGTPFLFSSTKSRLASSRSAAPTSATSSTATATTSAAACPCAAPRRPPCRAPAPASGAARARYPPAPISSSLPFATSRGGKRTSPSTPTARRAATCSSSTGSGSATPTASSSTAPTTSTCPSCSTGPSGTSATAAPPGKTRRTSPAEVAHAASALTSPMAPGTGATAPRATKATPTSTTDA